MSSKPTIFLDVHIEGMKEFLQDFRWKVETVTEVYGPTPEGRRDDNIMAYAESNKNSIVVSQDQKLIKRLQNKGLKVVGIDMADLARQVNETLKKDFD